ncbi:MAG: hypothetical protein M9890_12850 [Thermomicrobiales bacterium]|nr:hypothetical protein [Thermomicrobiales bacterium]
MALDESVERWQYLEALGFDSLWLCDHLIQPSNPTSLYFEDRHCWQRWLP